jgi:HAD superfamily hydrolase (TIGR01490 family)
MKDKLQGGVSNTVSGSRLERPAVAIFDLDGTLVVGQTQLLLARFLSRVGLVSRPFLLGTALWFLGYKAGLLRATEASREKGARVLQGLTTQEVDSLMSRFTEEIMAPRLHPASTAALAQHLAQGDVVVVVSAALEPLVAALCGRLEVERYVGVPCEVIAGRYTGRVSGPIPYGKEKARIAADLIAESGADPADCWAYADHDTDLELLRSVGHPVAVSPRPLLLAVAQQEGWPILLDPGRGPQDP